MATVHWLNSQQMVEFCREYMCSVLEEADRRLAPVAARRNADPGRQEQAEAEIYRAVRRGDFAATVQLCDGYLKRVALTVKTLAQAEVRPVPPKRRAA